MSKAGDAWEWPSATADGEGFIDQGELSTNVHAFDRDALDDLFLDPSARHIAYPISPDELSFLKKNVLVELEEAATNALPRGPAYRWQFLELLDCWYDGEALSALPTVSHWEDLEDNQQMTREEFIREGSHAIFHYGPVFEAEYLVRTHAAGYGIASNKPLSTICQDHIFAKWPNYLFQQLEAEFRKEARFLLSPGFAFPLPPITSLVLSKAKSRDEIPESIVAIRRDFEKSRKELWSLLAELWTTRRYKDQVVINRALAAAADSIYRAAFPDRSDSLSIAMEFAPLSLGAVSSGMRRLLQHDEPNRKVRAISFAYRLSKYLRKSLRNQPELLKRHLTRSELAAFGKF